MWRLVEEAHREEQVIVAQLLHGVAEGVAVEGRDDGPQEGRVDADAEDPLSLETLSMGERDRRVEVDGERPAALARPDAEQLVDAFVSDPPPLTG